MADTAQTAVFCSQCSEWLDQPSSLPVTVRSPCPKCGSLVRRIDIQVASKLSISARVTTQLAPGKQERDWRQRLVQIRDHLRRILALHTESLSADSINAANHELQSYFVQAYHVKDALIQDAATTGIAKGAVEAAVTADPHLAMLAERPMMRHQRCQGATQGGY